MKAKNKKVVSIASAPKAVKSKYNPIVGNLGKLVFLKPEEINLGAIYQRPVTNKVEQIAKNWDWRLYQPINVSFRDGNYWCYDGKHKVTAALMRGDIDLLPCYVLDIPTKEEEAHCFVYLNEVRTRVKPAEKYKGLEIAGSPEHKFAQNLLDKYGLTPRHSNNAKFHKPYTCGGIGAILNKAKTEYGKSLCEDAFILIDKCWRGEGHAYSGRMIEGVFRLVASVENRKRLLEEGPARLGQYTSESLFTEADQISRITKVAINSVFSDLLMRKLNYKLAKNKFN